LTQSADAERFGCGGQRIQHPHPGRPAQTCTCRASPRRRTESWRAAKSATVLVRTVLAVRTTVTVRARTEGAPPTQARECVGDCFSGLGILSAHALNFTCNLTWNQIACHTTYTCK